MAAGEGWPLAVARLRAARCLVALTGAGISTPSGLPDFRSPDGLYRQQARAEEILSLSYFARDPEGFWDFYRARLLGLHRAAPNAAHHALAALEAAGRLRAVVTQNVDGLHRAAGSVRVWELHGRADALRCARGHREAMADWLPRLEAGEVPRCPRCRLPLRPDIVLFGEPLDPEVWRQAAADAQDAEALLVVGTSLRVAPASWLAVAARDRGATVVVVDRAPEHIAAPLRRGMLVLAGDAAQVLPELAAALIGA
jgi:NAD-dependent deacetylase